MAARKKTRAEKSRATNKAPWLRPAPKEGSPAHLSPREKAAAKTRAKRAGRRYPNLIDNMRAAKKK